MGINPSIPCWSGLNDLTKLRCWKWCMLAFELDFGTRGPPKMNSYVLNIQVIHPISLLFVKLEINPSIPCWSGISYQTKLRCLKWFILPLELGLGCGRHLIWTLCPNKHPSHSPNLALICRTGHKPKYPLLVWNDWPNQVELLPVISISFQIGFRTGGRPDVNSIS